VATPKSPGKIVERVVRLYEEDWKWVDKEVEWYGTNVAYVIGRLICKERKEQESWPPGRRGAKEDGDGQKR